MTTRSVAAPSLVHGHRWSAAALAVVVCGALSLALIAVLSGWSWRDSRLGQPLSPNALAVAYEDGSVIRLSADGTPEEALPAEVLRHLFSVTRTQLATDTHTGLLWYSDTHTVVRSVDPRSGELGPSLGGFADVALIGCATTGDRRPIAIDALRRRLFVPIATGGILVYDLDTLRLTNSVGAGEVATEPGLLPAVATDDRTGALWYGSRDDSLVELAGPQFRPSGRQLPYASDAHGLRALSASGGRLLALGGDGSLRAYDLARLSEMQPPALPGAGQPVGIAAGG